MIPQGHVQQHILIHALLGILRLTGDGVNDTIGDPAIFLSHQIQLTGAIFNGEDALIVGDRGEQPAGHCGFSRAGCSRHTDRDAIPQTGGKKVQHRTCGCAAPDKILLLHILRVDDSDRGADSHILIHQRSLEYCDTDIFGEMAQYGGAGIVQHHTGNMEHPADHIDGMVGAVEVLLQLDHLAAGIQNFNITPGIDIDLLNTGAEDVLGEEAKLGHLGVEGIHQLFPGQIPDGNAPILDIFADVSLDLLLGIRSHTICDEGGIFAGDIFLNILQHRTEIPALILRCEEQGVAPLASSGFRGDGTPGQVICIGECCRRGLGLRGRLNRLIQRSSLQSSLLLLQNRLRGLNGAVAGTKQRIVSLLS